MLAWLYEREKLKFGPVELPAYGERPLITHSRSRRARTRRQRRLPNPWVGAQPGQLLHRPAAQPTPARFLYEGGLPDPIGGRTRTRPTPPTSPASSARSPTA